MAPTDPLRPRPAPGVTRGRPIPGRPSDGITRRRLLVLASGAIAAGILAACGEEAPAELAGVALPDGARRAPRAPRDVGLPEPGARRTMIVAIVGHLGSAPFDVLETLSAADKLSDHRYRYRWVEVPAIPPVVDWDPNPAIAALPAPEPELALLFGQDLQALVAGRSLRPLDDPLRADAAFDRSGYWPGVLEACQVGGIQYGLPVAVIPHVIVVNREVADQAGVELPRSEPSAFDRNQFVTLARSLHTPPNDDGSGGTPGFMFQINAEPDPDLFSAVFPSSFDFLSSAVGQLGTPDGSFAGLRTEAATRALEDVRSLVNDFGFALAERTWLENARANNYGMLYYGLGGRRSARLPDHVIYPFPDFGSGLNPVGIAQVLGITAASEDPAVAYNAISYLEAALLGSLGLFPARRSSPSELEGRYEGVNSEEAELAVDVLEHAAFVVPSRRERRLIVETLDRGAVLGDLDPAEALNRAADELAALRAG